MKPTKFTLEHLFYPEISVKATSDFDPESQSELTQPTIQIFLNRSTPHTFHLGLRLSLAAEVPADKYAIEAFAVGVFKVDETLPDDQQVRLIAHSGPNLVFAGLRDMIATVTGRGPWGEHYLQPQIIEPEDFITHDNSLQGTTS